MFERAGIAAPDVLARGQALGEIWTDPRLLLAQTCGYPLVTTLKDRVAVLATPCYDAPGCTGPSYRSAVIVRASEHASGLSNMRGRICAMNGPESNSGMNLLRAAVAPPGPRGWPVLRQNRGDGRPIWRACARWRAAAADIAAIDLRHLGACAAALPSRGERSACVMLDSGPRRACR